jgi:hypothetical protein
MEKYCGKMKIMISQIDLKELLDKIIELHFDNYKFTQKGSLEWCPIIGKIQSKNRVIYKNINP